MSQSRTSLSRFSTLMEEPDPKRGFDACRQAFHKDGIVCISIQDIEARCGWVAAKHLRGLGEQYFGKQGK